MGLDIGVANTGRFHLLACVEKEKAFCDTIWANINAGNIAGKPKVYKTDIKNLDPQVLMRECNIEPGHLDLLIGGPPCQTFSTAGKRGTVLDKRGTLLWDFLRFIKAMQPKVFLMENVRGLLSAALRHRPIALRPEKGGPPLERDEEPGSVVREFARELQEFIQAPYHMDCFEVNAVNYGAPQLRERALFIGNRYNLDVPFPSPTHGPKRGNGSEPDLFDSLPELKPVPWQTLGDALKGLREETPTVMDFSPRKKSFLAQVPPGGNWRHLPEDMQKASMGKAFFAKGGRSGWWRRLSHDLPCPTLVTMPNHASTSLCHPNEVRALTVGEYKRIQEFPDKWIVCGTPTEQYTQIGNAVPTRLGQIAGETIATLLDTAKKNRLKPYSGKPREYRRVYIQSHVRTRQWFKNGKALLWKDGHKNRGSMYAAPKTVRAFRIMEKE